MRLKLILLTISILICNYCKSQDISDETRYTEFQRKKGVISIEKSEQVDSLVFSADLKIIINKKSIFSVSHPLNKLIFCQINIISKEYQQHRGYYFANNKYIFDLDEIISLINLSKKLPIKHNDIILYNSKYQRKVHINLKAESDFFIFFKKNSYDFEKLNLTKFKSLIKKLEELYALEIKK